MKLMVIIDLLVIVATALTYFLKISIHSLTAWGIVGVLIMLNKSSEVNALFLPVIAAVLLTGFIMSARVQLRVHSLREVMLGAVAGIATSILGMITLFEK